MPARLPVKPIRSRGAGGSRRGSALIELALVLTVALPLLFGITGVGVRLGRTVEGTQITRDVAHLYALGTDFSLAGTQAIARTLAGDFNLTATGNAVLIFSRIIVVYQTDCNTAGLQSCPNQGLPVFVQRIVIGNAGLRSSAYGTPPANYIDTSGNIKSADYCVQTSLVAQGFASVLTLAQSQSAWMVEGYFNMPELDLLSGGGTQVGGYYVRLVF